MIQRSLDPIDEVVARVYEAALDPPAWQGTLEHASELVGARSAMLFVADWRTGSYAPRILAQHRMDAAVLREWQASYLPHDLWSHEMSRLPPSFVTTGAAVVDPKELRRSVFYADVLRKLGMEDALSTSLARGDGVEVPLSFYARDLFQRSHLRLLERLTRHLRLAVQLQFQLGAFQHRTDVMKEIVDRMAVGIMTLERDGRVVWANRQAETILDGRDGLSLRNRRLCCARTDEMALLDAAIGAAAAADCGAAAGQALSISRRSGRRPLAVVVAPVRSRDGNSPLVGAGGFRRAAVVVTVRDPERRIEVLPERLCRIFGLSRAEARLTAAVAMERTLAEYADEAGITLHTARWTLKQVLQKTGCRRQSELVRLVLVSGAALVEIGTRRGD